MWVKWMEWLDDRIEDMMDMAVPILIVIVVAAMGTGLIIWAVGSDNAHRTSCQTVLNQRHTARDSLMIYQYDKFCFEIQPETSVKVQTQASGLTTEQENVARRLTEDNKPGSIKHLYVISAYSGDVLIYFIVRGKVTSSGKRLTPRTVVGGYNFGTLMGATINGERYTTNEVIEDDGTYGSSVEYIYWWDTRGVYHQHYISGGQIVTISSQPLAVRHIVLNFEAVPKD